ncbi:MAG TPA: hypothetical protein VLX92_07745 [Kofleriaceae bacterium]|nr:hypothetical protein [Kofleriaceae bacterium]
MRLGSNQLSAETASPVRSIALCWTGGGGAGGATIGGAGTGAATRALIGGGTAGLAANGAATGVVGGGAVRVGTGGAGRGAEAVATGVGGIVVGDMRCGAGVPAGAAVGGRGGGRVDLLGRVAAGSGGMVCVRDGGAVIMRTGCAGSWCWEVPPATRRGSGATSPADLWVGGIVAVIRGFGGLNSKSSEGSGLTCRFDCTDEISWFTAVDSVFAMSTLPTNVGGRIANGPIVRKRNPVSSLRSLVDGVLRLTKRAREVRSRVACSRCAHSIEQFRRADVMVTRLSGRDLHVKRDRLHRHLTY